MGYETLADGVAKLVFDCVRTPVSEWNSGQQKTVLAQRCLRLRTHRRPALRKEKAAYGEIIFFLIVISIKSHCVIACVTVRAHPGTAFTAILLIHDCEESSTIKEVFIYGKPERFFWVGTLHRGGVRSQARLKKYLFIEHLKSVQFEVPKQNTLNQSTIRQINQKYRS